MKADEKLRASDYPVDIPWRPVPSRAWPTSARVAEAFDAGATIVVQGLHHWWPALATFCRSLEAALGHPAQANAYWTPRSAQGLPVHHDTHDVFCLQIAGEKRWLVYEPVLELPLKDQRYVAELGAPGEPVLDVTLQAGDTLYLPRGWLHQAMTSDVDSLHLTVGVERLHLARRVRAALEECADDVGFRRSPDGGSADELLGALAERLGRTTFARRMRRELVRGRRPVLDGRVGQLRALATSTRRPRSSGARRCSSTSSCGDGRARLAFEGAHARVPCARRRRAGVRAPRGRAVSPGRPAGQPRRGGSARARRAPRARRAARSAADER